MPDHFEGHQGSTSARPAQRTLAKSGPLPSGVVTFLLSDVEGSTRLWEGDQDTMGAAIARHYELLDAAITLHGGVLQRNLLYTGITRGKRLAVLVGQKKAIAIAIRNVSGRRRWSKLDEWLRTIMPVALSGAP